MFPLRLLPNISISVERPRDRGTSDSVDTTVYTNLLDIVDHQYVLNLACSASHSCLISKHLCMPSSFGRFTQLVYVWPCCAILPNLPRRSHNHLPNEERTLVCPS